MTVRAQSSLKTSEPISRRDALKGLGGVLAASAVSAQAAASPTTKADARTGFARNAAKAAQYSVDHRRRRAGAAL